MHDLPERVTVQGLESDRRATLSIRIGLIGAGGIAHSHAEGLAGAEGGRIVAVADPMLERATDLAKSCGAQAFADYHDLLDLVDVVWICTPPFLHHEQAIACARAGKHLFVEKPFALSVADCQDIIDAARAAGVKLTVGQVFHHYPLFQEVQHRLQDGAIGDLISCWSRRYSRLPASLTAPWRLNVQQLGSYVLEMQVHELDLVTWFAGRPLTVRGVVTRNDPAFPNIDNSMSALITYAGGCIGEVSGSWSPRASFSHRGAIGTHGSIIISAWDHFRLTVDGQEEQRITVPGGSDQFPVGIRAEDQHFLRCIERNEQPLVSGEMGRQAVALGLATISSSDTTAVVTLASE
jgi:predicted dehydrogenase